MSNWKKKVGLKNTISNKDITKIESITQSIHQNSSTQKEPVVKMTIDVPKSLSKAIKIKVAQDEITIKDYILNLVRTDLGMV